MLENTEHVAMTITAANGIRFLVRLDPLRRSAVDLKPVVEFYDTRYPHLGEFGQYVASYYVETLLGDLRGDHHRLGLNLHGGEPDWTIDGPAMRVVLEWLRHETRA